MIKRIHFDWRFLVTLILAGSLSSCSKINPSWELDILTPLVSSKLDIGDIFGDTNVVSNPDQSVSLVLTQHLDFLEIDSMINLKDTISVDIFNIPFTLVIPPGQKVIEKQSVTKLNFGNMELVEARAATAKMKFYVVNTVQQPLLVKYQLFSASKDGVIFETFEDVSAATTSAAAVVVKSIDLANYTMNLTGTDGTQINTIYALTTVWIHPDADTAFVTTADSIAIISTFEEFKPLYARGYLGSQWVNQSASSSIRAFINFRSGSFDLKNVKAGIEINNYVGADFSLQINQIEVKNTKTNASSSLNHSIIGKQINISRAVESNIPAWPVYGKHYYFDLSPSNLDQMLELMPNQLNYNLSAQFNPLGNISFGHDFIYFNHSIDASINLEIPLNFSANDLVIESTADYNLQDEAIQGGFLNAYLDNWFPFEMSIQFYILDSDNQLVDSLLSPNAMLIAATPNPNTAVVSLPKKTKMQIELSDDLLHKLRNANKMLIRAKINSSQNQAFKFYEHYRIEVQIVGDFNYGL